MTIKEEAPRAVMRYTLERSEIYIVRTEMLQNCTHQSTRWKQVAMSDDLNALRKIMLPDQRIIDRDLKVVCRS